jgi:hypothetical protein
MWLRAKEGIEIALTVTPETLAGTDTGNLKQPMQPQIPPINLQTPPVSIVVRKDT